MKTSKKSVALFLGLVMTILTGISTMAATVTVPDESHTYVAYQIFTGTQAESEGALGNVQWGDGIASSAFLDALKAETTAFSTGTFGEGGYVANVFADCVTAADVAAAFVVFADGSAAAEKFAKLALANKSSTYTELTPGTTDLADGYYLIVDTTNVEGQDDVANPAVLQVTRDITIAAKTDKPSIDKQVWDEEADAEAGHAAGWGESADHAINETFQLKLIATLPADIRFDRYATYAVKFTDNWSEGITYEEIVSVEIDDVTLNAGQYSLTVNDMNRTMTIEIADIKVLGANLTDGAVITVIYNAHLNEDAVIANTATIADDTADDNQNEVYLEYSNNPDGSGLGKTPKDVVYVFTYEVLNTKYEGSAVVGNEFSGVGFKLYESNGITEVELIYDTALAAYRPVKAGETAVEMFSAETTGIFNIKGLDAGTYILKETTTPEGYNTCEDIIVVISATHIEDADHISATVTFTELNSNTDNDIVNRSGSVLPETGGIGTTIFYIIGGILIVVAVVLLVTRKKVASKKDNFD
ncbi:MAG: isopeptide-forming domain-containing fimbrial protein [Lachnospiraceae bacterium]|jgi:fimbrial isopeptide formation D2 family protein/LPXTG-motif cell wall-anchored protein